MRKYSVYAIDQNECCVFLDKTTKEPYLHVTEEAELPVVEVDANDFDHAFRVYELNKANYDHTVYAIVDCATDEVKMFTE